MSSSTSITHPDLSGNSDHGTDYSRATTPDPPLVLTVANFCDLVLQYGIKPLLFQLVHQHTTLTGQEAELRHIFAVRHEITQALDLIDEASLDSLRRPSGDWEGRCISQSTMLELMQLARRNWYSRHPGATEVEAEDGVVPKELTTVYLLLEQFTRDIGYGPFEAGYGPFEEESEANESDAITMDSAAQGHKRNRSPSLPAGERRQRQRCE